MAKVNLKKDVYLKLAKSETGCCGQEVNIAQIGEIIGDLGDLLREMPVEQAVATVLAIIERAGKRGKA